MKIIKFGILPDKTFRATCDNCKCLFEFCAREMREFKGGLEIGCPTKGCKKTIGIANCVAIEEPENIHSDSGPYFGK